MNIKLLFTLFFIGLICNAQNRLYKDISYLIPIKEAKKLVRQNPEDYKNVNFSEGVVYSLYPVNITRNTDNQVVGLNFIAPYLNGVDHDTAQLYLNKTYEVLVEKNYKVYFQPDNWNVPILYDYTNLHGMLLVDESESIIVEIIATQLSNGLYSPSLIINNFQNFKDHQAKREQKNQEIIESNGF